MPLFPLKTDGLTLPCRPPTVPRSLSLAPLPELLHLYRFTAAATAAAASSALPPMSSSTCGLAAPLEARLGALAATLDLLHAAMLQPAPTGAVVALSPVPAPASGAAAAVVVSSHHAAATADAAAPASGADAAVSSGTSAASKAAKEAAGMELQSRARLLHYTCCWLRRVTSFPGGQARFQILTPDPYA